MARCQTKMRSEKKESEGGKGGPSPRFHSFCLCRRPICPHRIASLRISSATKRRFPFLLVLFFFLSFFGSFCSVRPLGDVIGASPLFCAAVGIRTAASGIRDAETAKADEDFLSARRHRSRPPTLALRVCSRKMLGVAYRYFRNQSRWS